MRIKCPICKNTTTWEENPWRPFCSERCKLIDLGKWASEDYRVEGKPATDEEAPSSEAGNSEENS